MQTFNEENRFGSARFAEEDELRAAGLFGRSGPQIGYFGQTPLRFDSDAPIITIGGAGSGKLRDLLGYVVCNTPGQSMLILDPRGELAAISHHIHAFHGDNAYPWSPTGSGGWSCNPLDILDINSPHFHADCKFIAESLIPLSGSGTGKYFELRARGWLESFLKHLAERNGTVTLPALHRLINCIESDTAQWSAHLHKMMASRFEDVRRTAGEMLVKQTGDALKEFSAILGEIYAYLGFLDDPALLKCLERSDFSLADLCDPERACKIFLNIPAEYLSIWSPLLRLFFTAAMLHKSRRPQARRILLLVDEAGQLGRFDMLLRAFSYGRGAGVRAHALFQDLGQVITHYGAASLQSFLGSAALRQFFGVRDYQTAQLVSDMVGSQTLYYDDTTNQDVARRQKRQALSRLLDDADSFAAAYDLSHYERAARHRTAQHRRLITPEEVLALPEDRQVLFLSGRNLPPVLANKYPYYTRREMAGLYLPNPYHPPADKMRVQTLFGSKWAEVVTEEAPEFLRSFPQHADGTYQYVRGYRPKF